MAEELATESFKDVDRPVKLAHFVLRTSRLPEMLAWYKFVFGATVTFESELIAFLTYDDEHHRIALLQMPGLQRQPGGIVGVHHVAFTYASLSALLRHYERLRDSGIRPAFPINHGPTTSLYYVDPEGNQLEFQVENYDTVAESTQFFTTPQFAENPIGVEFDPEALLRRLCQGEPESDLKRRPDIGGKGLSGIKLR